MEHGTDAPNPFVYGRELQPDELVDRTTELDRIAATIRNREKLFLIGPRRFGKSTVLLAAAAAAEANHDIVLRFDAEKYESPKVLADALLGGLTTALNVPSNRSRDTASRRRPDASDLEPVGEFRYLTNALDAVEEAAAANSERRVVVIMDEFQQLLLDHGERAEKVLRATIQEHSHVGYVFAGSGERLLSDATSKPDRPFYQFGARLYLGPIPTSDFLEFLRGGFERFEFTFESAGLKAILEFADEVPYNVQRIANVSWEMLRAGEASSLSPATVAKAVERIVWQEDPAYSQIWTQLTRNQKITLKAVIANRGEKLLSGAVTQAAGVPASSMQTALETLEQKQLIRPEFREGKLRFRLVDPCMGSWLTIVQARHG